MHKHGLSADLLKAVSSILNGEQPVEEKMSSKEKMKKGLYNDNSNDKSDDGEGMDKVQPKALKKKFADRKDKDIDNDGDEDSSDEYLHNKRKAVSKSIKKEANESVDLDDKNVEKALKHDCATHIVHEKWGNGQCIPGMHTLEQISEEEGIVTHYDVLFDHGIEENISVKEMKVIKSMNHGHTKKKSKVTEAKCDCDCGKSPCIECGKDHHDMKSESK